MSLTSDQAQNVLIDIESLKIADKTTKVYINELREQQKESHEQHKSTMLELQNVSEKMSNLVTVLEVKNANDEHIKSDVELNRVEIKEISTKLESFEDKAWPILRKAQDNQKLKDSMINSMSSSVGKLIIGLIVAGLLYTVATTFGLTIGTK